MYRGAEYTVDFNPKVKIELVVAEDMLDKVVSTVREAAALSGKIFVLPMKEVVRVRTGERRREAI